MIYKTFMASQPEFETTKRLNVWRRRVYFGTQSLDAGEGDVHRVFHVKAGDVVLNVWLDVITACPANSTVDVGYGTVVDYWGNGMPLDATGNVKQMLVQNTNLYPYLLTQGNQEAIDIEVDGAAFNDSVVVTPDDTDIADMVFMGHVSWANMVTIRMMNLADTELKIYDTPVTAKIIVDKAPLAKRPLVFGSADTIDLKATTDTADVNINSGVVDVYALVVRP